MTHPEFHSAEPLDRSEWIPLSALAEGFGRPPFGDDTPEHRIENLHRELSEHPCLMTSACLTYAAVSPVSCSPNAHRNRPKPGP